MPTASAMRPQPAAAGIADTIRPQPEVSTLAHLQPEVSTPTRPQPAQSVPSGRSRRLLRPAC
jgi:hypothetical protein